MPSLTEKPTFEIRPEMGQPTPEKEAGAVSHLPQESGEQSGEHAISKEVSSEQLPIVTQQHESIAKHEEPSPIKSLEDINEILGSARVSTVPTDNAKRDPRLLIESLGEAIEQNNKQ